jgi:F0F1-type ATP synthase assembly protein I
MTTERAPRRPEKKDAGRVANEYLRYTGLGFTMAGMILGSFLLGWWLDPFLGLKFPVLTLTFGILGIVGAMIHLFKETGRK